MRLLDCGVADFVAPDQDNCVATTPAPASAGTASRVGLRPIRDPKGAATWEPQARGRALTRPGVQDTRPVHRSLR
jgi:hypothetical protein